MKITELRAELGKSQSEFAEMLGLASKGHVSNIENGTPCSVRVALEIERLSGGRISAAEISKDVALVVEHQATQDAA